MARPNGKLAILLIGLVFGWYVAEKGWHRHLAYLAVICVLIAALWR